MKAQSHPGGLDLARLPRMSVDELRRLWAEHIGRKPPSQKRILVRELAWRVQERIHGGFDHETRRLLQSAMRDGLASIKDRGVRSPADGETPEAAYHPAKRGPKAARALPSASKLIRTWRGRSHEVEVLDGGRSFRYQGREFKSLSEIAKLITGTHWSGPRFFGLTSRSSPNGREGVA